MLFKIPVMLIYAVIPNVNPIKIIILTVYTYYAFNLQYSNCSGWYTHHNTIC